MSDDCCGGPPRPGLSRRGFLQAAAAGAALVATGSGAPAAAAAPARSVAPGLAIQPREAWAAGLAPRGPLEVEQPGDVRFLLVHHTASPNGYPPDGVVDQLRRFFRFHTGGERGWPDIAYNFLVDSHGGVWEGRQGSLQAPVKGSATGGSQGFAMLACFIGDLTTTGPTPLARTSMLRLLAWLADTYQVDTAPGATASFTSRGSNRWPAGTPVTTATIAGHRDMSVTTCPGDACYAQVREEFPRDVTALRGAPPAPAPAPAPAEGAPKQTLTPVAVPSAHSATSAVASTEGAREVGPVVAGVAALAVSGAAAATVVQRRAQRD